MTIFMCNINHVTAIFQNQEVEVKDRCLSFRYFSQIMVEPPVRCDRRPGGSMNKAVNITSDEDDMPLRSGPWSDDEINLLFSLWATGASNAKISSRLNRRENAIAVKASRLKLPPKATIFEGHDLGQVRNRNPQAKVRACLTCRRQFFSDGPGNRVCDICKSSAAWSGEGAYTVQFGGR